MTGVDHVLGGAETSDTTVETESEREPHLLGNVLDEAALLTEGEVGKLEQKIGIGVKDGVSSPDHDDEQYRGQNKP